MGSSMDSHTLAQISKSFARELQNGKMGQKTSLPFIRHTLAQISIVENDEVFQVMVIGGSYYQKALMQKTDGLIKMLSHSEGTQPPFLKEHSLMEFLEKHIDPQVKTVAINFAYPLKPINRKGRLDGVLANGSKENTFEGLVGHALGERVEKYFQENLNRILNVSCANDTICLLLSGLMHHTWDHLCAGVVGTGLNFALFLDEHTVVNLESNKFEQSEAGKIIDDASVAPGSAFMEKEVSGAYLYHHFNIEAKKRSIALEKISSTKTIDEYAKNEDQKIATLAQDILHHSASLVAVQVAGILEFCQRDLTFIMQGSLFWKGYKYKETVEKTVRDLSPNFQASFIQIEHSDLYGAAKLVG